MKHIFTFIIILLVAHTVRAQNTVGLLSHQPSQVEEGYNLFFPHNQSSIFLIDNCGQLIQEWTDADSIRPGNAVELLPDGNIVVCKRPNNSIQDPIWAGGGGETVQIRTWENNLLASFTLNNDLFRLHHDIAPLPNGNILMIAWALKDSTEAINAGRNPVLLPQGEVWSEVVLEWNPVLDSVVWEWHVWDHLIQDFDRDRDNFGVVSNHSERINLNYDEHDGHPDWLHINGIAYNPVLDHIVLSVPYFNEIWVIDHSTTKEEAASSFGGQSGKGGDLLYRWGNPATYNQGNLDNKVFFFQHDIHWSKPNALPGEPGFGEMAVFNNRVDGAKSFAHKFSPSFDTATWNYRFTDGLFRYGPEEVSETRIHPDTITKSFSSSVSSIQILNNGNWLFMAGRWGYAYELNPAGEVVWEYITPLNRGMRAAQGATLGINDNMTFRMKRYAADFSGFIGKDLSPKGFIEINPNEGFCGLAVSTEEVIHRDEWKIFPNPIRNWMSLEVPEKAIGQNWTLHNLLGQKLQSGPIHSTIQQIDLGNLGSGVYVFGVGNQSQKIIVE